MCVFCTADVWHNSLYKGSANRQVLYKASQQETHETRAYISVASETRNRYPSARSVKTVLIGRRSPNVIGIITTSYL